MTNELLTGSIFFPYAIRDIAYISRWSKSAKLINSFWEKKVEKVNSTTK